MPQAGEIVPERICKFVFKRGINNKKKMKEKERNGVLENNKKTIM